ncbi:response regulator transcription factor [Lacrimispora sp.]|uniref:response regulator transcription factor n=1 Tax=Lacrimispora sp. TaxID=2719234 RepID=UPI0028ABE51A|nr:response regulator [Lacrimispora sp.]
MSSILNYKYIVAEDESLIRRNLVKKIASLNLPFTLAGEASNGEEAILLMEEHFPDLVITDIRMPPPDGLELAQYIQKNHPGTRTILLSGYSDFAYALSALRCGVMDYLLKPVTLEALSGSLHKILITMAAESDELDSYRSSNSRLDQRSICELLETYLQENYQQEISFQELGEKFGFTPEYLGKLFKKHTGETPSKYLTRLRMNEAKRLLLNNPDMEIQKVGELVGYRDGFYFSRTFKSHTGIQPSEFRHQGQRGR